MSPIWQTIRLFALLQPFFLTRVCSFVIKYISQNSFLTVSFQPCQCPRKKSGIALIGPGNQLAVLQLCWIQPLLLSSGDKPLYDTFVTEILRHCQSHFSYTVSHLIPLLFPDHQSTTIKSLGYFKTLFATIDKIDYEIDWNAFKSGMANEPSLTRICLDVIAPHLDFHPSRWSSILVEYAYIIDPSCGKFRRRPLFSSDPFRNRVNQSFDLLSTKRKK
ncbi:hypothetical protein G6F37_009947 [Rhizopus arrhizus]|nr:hypothetical protein G6F38_010047 [Rhizopus arrhizus]KAG1153890.1 hypothetical protein G6F37_009947 [Rhizopus arrhizus]